MLTSATYLNCKKLVCSGNLVEVISWSSRGKNKVLVPKENLCYSVLPLRDSAPYRAITKFRRLAYSNAYRWSDSYGSFITPRMLTLTFGRDVRDVATANRYFSKFVMRVNYSGLILGGFQYQVVLEFTKRDRIHYHVIVYNQPFIDGIKSKFQDLWRDSNNGGGYIYYKTFDGSGRSAVDYCSKYFVKSFRDVRMKHKRRHFHSKGLIRSIEIKDEGHMHFIEKSFSGEFLIRKYSGVGYDVRVYEFPIGTNPLPEFVLDSPLSSFKKIEKIREFNRKKQPKYLIDIKKQF